MFLKETQIQKQKQKHYITMYHKLTALTSYENSSNVLYDAVQPDIVLKRNHHIIAIELTCCFETNLVHSRNFKTQKYKNIKRYGKVTVSIVSGNVITLFYCKNI